MAATAPPLPLVELVLEGRVVMAVLGDKEVIAVLGDKGVMVVLEGTIALTEEGMGAIAPKGTSTPIRLIIPKIQSHQEQTTRLSVSYILSPS